MATKEKPNKILTLTQFTKERFDCLGGVLYILYADMRAGNLIQDCGKYTKAEVKKEYEKYLRKEEKKKLNKTK